MHLHRNTAKVSPSGRAIKSHSGFRTPSSNFTPQQVRRTTSAVDQSQQRREEDGKLISTDWKQFSKLTVRRMHPRGYAGARNIISFFCCNVGFEPKWVPAAALESQSGTNTYVLILVRVYHRLFGQAAIETSLSKNILVSFRGFCCYRATTVSLKVSIQSI